MLGDLNYGDDGTSVDTCPTQQNAHVSFVQLLYMDSTSIKLEGKNRKVALPGGG